MVMVFHPKNYGGVQMVENHLYIGRYTKLLVLHCSCRQRSHEKNMHVYELYCIGLWGLICGVALAAAVNIDLLVPIWLFSIEHRQRS